MKKLRFVWIDDSTEREIDAINLADELEVKVEFVSLFKEEVSKKLVTLTEGAEPDLIILDHSLNKSISETIKTGSTAASFLHETWPKCPIVSCTAVEPNEIDFRNKSAYEAMFQSKCISSHYSTILSIAEGFKLLKSIEIKNIDVLINTLSFPSEDLQNLKKIIPMEIKEDVNDIGIISEWFRWCDNILFRRPGFLYNEQWAANFLGLTLDGFKTISSQFELAKYSGVFKDESNPLWWKSLLLDELTKKIEITGLPWVVGRELVSDETMFSKCYVSNEDFPETIAATDGTNSSSWQPMKLKKTVSHPSFENMLFFEDLRIMLAE